MERLSAFERNAVFATGTLQLAEKIKTLHSRPDITFSDFSTRRLQQKLAGIRHSCAGPGNARTNAGDLEYRMAIQYGLLPVGTMAHEMYMVLAGVMAQSDDTIRTSHNRVLQEWWEEYDWGLSIALTDTYGSDFFFCDMTAAQARTWKGLRQDSGDPMAFGRKPSPSMSGMALPHRISLSSSAMDWTWALSLSSPITSPVGYALALGGGRISRTM